MWIPTTSRWRHRSLIVDGVIAALLLFVSVASTAGQRDVEHPWTELVVASWMGLVALRTAAPLLMVVGVSCAVVLYAVMGSPSTPLWSFVAVLVVGFSVGAHLGGRRLLGGLALLLVSAYILQIETTSHSGDAVSFADTYVSPLVLIGGPALAGMLLRHSRRQTARLRRLTEELAVERERHAASAALEERQRIARELHDVISHSVTVMVVQAGAAEKVLPPDSLAGVQVRAVRETGKEALAELRRQLGVLRDGGPQLPVPLPGLEQLPDLVATAGARLTVSGEPSSAIAPGLALTVYRVVQEALTNARRHAVGAETMVAVTYVSDGIEVRVDDSGGRWSGVTGGGNGLRGMGERVAMYGGRLAAGPAPGGWSVEAFLPVTVESAS